MSAGLERIAQKAQASPRERFTALAHHLTEDFLKETFLRMNPHGAPGIDRVSMNAYGQQLDANVADLVARLKRRAYDAPSVRRVYIPKAGNAEKLRPLGIPGGEDRMLRGPFGQGNIGRLDPAADGQVTCVPSIIMTMVAPKAWLV